MGLTVVRRPGGDAGSLHGLTTTTTTKQHEEDLLVIHSSSRSTSESRRQFEVLAKGLALVDPAKALQKYSDREEAEVHRKQLQKHKVRNEGERRNKMGAAALGFLQTSSA